MAMFLINILHFIQSGDQSRMDALCAEYIAAHDKLVSSLVDNVFIHQEMNHFSGKVHAMAYGSCGNYTYIVNNYKSDMENAKHVGYFLTDQVEMRIGFNDEKKLFKLSSYAKYKSEYFQKLRRDLYPNGLEYLHSIPYGSVNLKEILSHRSKDGVEVPVEVKLVEELKVEGERRVRFYLRFTNLSFEQSDYLVTKAHAMLELAPERAWVVVAGSNHFAEGFERVWKNEFEGSINGVPKIKKITDKAKSLDGKSPDRLTTITFVKYEPLTSIDATIFTPDVLWT